MLFRSGKPDKPGHDWRPKPRRAIVVHVARKSGADTGRTEQSRLEEAMSLAAAIGLEVAEGLIATLAKPTPATLIGAGKVDEIKALAADLTPEVVIVNATVSPVQQRNLEKAWSAKVLDRTALILEIFGQRARTREGRLQVEIGRAHV